MNDTRKNGEQLVVTEGGKRISGNVHATEQSALAEAAQAKAKKPVNETAGSPAVAVKQQLFG